MNGTSGGRLEDRLRAIEDRLAIYQVLSSYVYAVDGLNADVVASCFTQDAVYEVGDLGAYRGHEEILGIVNDPGHGHIDRVKDGVAHLSTLPHVVIEGDRATATCHMVMARHRDAGFEVWRVSASRVELARQAEGGWKIVHRHNVLMDGDPAAPALLARVREGPDTRSPG